MAHPIVYVDTSEIREGKLEDLQIAMRDLSRFVEANMPRLISYGFFLDETRKTMTVVAVHPDSASLELHLDKGADEFRQFADLIELRTIEVYGTVGAGAVERMGAKARALGGGAVELHDLYAGFAR